MAAANGSVSRGQDVDDVDEVLRAPGGTAAVVVLRGRFDAVRAPAVRDDLDALAADGVVDLVVDLGDADFVDSAALAVLVRARRRTTAAGGRVALVMPRAEDGARVFRLTQFDQIFPLVERGELR